MPRRIDTEAVINAVRLDEQAGDPAQPAAGFWIVYTKAGGLYIQDDAGNVTGPLSAGGDVANDAIWDAAGDLVQATGANTAVKLPIGTYPQILRVNAGATAAEWVSAGRVLISEQTPTGTGTVTWNTIPATYKSLEIEWLVRGTESAAYVDLNTYFNNDSTASNYRRTIAAGYGTNTAFIEGADSYTLGGTVPAATATAGYAGQGWAKLINYASTTFHKMMTATFMARRSDASVEVFGGTYNLSWENTAAITRIDFVLSAGNYLAGSVLRLYGVF